MTQVLHVSCMFSDYCNKQDLVTKHLSPEIVVRVCLHLKSEHYWETHLTCEWYRGRFSFFLPPSLPCHTTVRSLSAFQIPATAMTAFLKEEDVGFLFYQLTYLMDALGKQQWMRFSPFLRGTMSHSTSETVVIPWWTLRQGLSEDIFIFSLPWNWTRKCLWCE